MVLQTEVTAEGMDVVIKQLTPNINGMPKCDVKNTPSIPEFFDQRNVFVTGAGGFMGKVLLEKLLRSCPEIGNIYILLRPKRGLSPAGRLEQILQVPIFDNLKKTNPEALAKIKVMLGDTAELELGLGQADIEIIKNTVSVVFNMAASVRFNDPLETAIITNARSVRELIAIAKEMKQLEVLVHVSTVYSNVDSPVIDEKVYPPRANWRTMIKMAESMDQNIISTLHDKILKGFPNTYTFTKSLAEDILHEAYEDLPIVIYRPAIVVNSYEEPLPGWAESLNGPMGMFVGVGTGLLHMLYGKLETVAEWIAVDQAVNGIIISAWYQANMKIQKQCLVFNAGCSFLRQYSYGEIIKRGLELTKQYPYKRMMWYPFVFLTDSKVLHFLGVVFFHIIPALIADVFLKLTGERLRLVKIYRKAYIANMALSRFMLDEWKIITKNFVALETIMLPGDRETFKIREMGDETQYRQNCFMGVFKYVMNEDVFCEKTLPKSRQRFRMFAIAHFTLLTISLVFLAYIAYWLLSRVSSRLNVWSTY